MRTVRAIDLHTHILPERWPDLRERFGYGGWVSLEHHGHCRARMMIDGQCFREIESNCWDPLRRIDECDAHGVDMQVLSTVPVMFAYWAKPRDAAELARILNDHLASVVARHPARFLGLGTIPMQDAALATRELERCVRELRMPGVQIGSNVHGRNLDEPEFADIFAAAEELGAAVFVHPWEMAGRSEMPRYWMPWLVGMPAETSRAICSLAFGGVLDRHPRLRLCFAHGGGSFPFTIGRIEKGFLERPDLCATRTTTSPRLHLGRLWFDSLVHDADALRHLVMVAGAERVALGSDYPFPLGEREPGALVRSIPEFDAKMRARLLAGNAIDFLGARGWLAAEAMQ